MLCDEEVEAAIRLGAAGTMVTIIEKKDLLHAEPEARCLYSGMEELLEVSAVEK